ncbi:dirigent protein 1 [Brachypodium distachyon]|uniref:Dirigent protein n=1 Tax=Brachypodium distachyon TaxID=15368 RepID=I1GS69_BRADI|nr:dirigent protein 1 [Brachypodium distachyon]KQK15143.1 hypothetical protein BRADI_1g20960v3 [Brachypodium distachyon]PNT74716.1 hypothetical protein BRADI_1g20960v3 [Brachypodium distachyon]|eukprot:XP_003559942.1 dirigent protein 1 [Brachypodium distachyon]
MASSPSPPLTLLLVALLVAATSAAGGKPTHIRLYVHEKFEGANATVASPLLRSPLGRNATFGEIGVLDDELRTGPRRRSSELVGRYQGFFVGTDLARPSYLSAITLVFTAAGERRRGSTLTVQGQYSFDVDGPVERAVVGGTGEFRMASGYSVLKFLGSPTPETAVFRIDLFVLVPSRGRYR